MQKIVIFLFLITTGYNLMAQKTSDTQLAMQYYNDKKYEQASDMFKQLFFKSHTGFYFDYYIRSLVKLKEYKTAQKVLKKQIRQKPFELSYLVQMGNLYQVQDDYPTAQKYYDKAISRVSRDRNAINRLANAFMSNQEYGYAEKVYLRARKTLKGLKFHYELANVYSAQKNYAKMINEYMEVLYESPSEIKNVKIHLQYFVFNLHDKDFIKLLKSSLIKRTQKFMNLPVYNDMLLWLYLQEKNYSAAFIQAKALDKRLGENSKRILQLAHLALNNKEYELAQKAYNYAIKNADRANYQNARLGLLNTYYQEISTSKIRSEVAINQVEREYVNTINEFGLNKLTIKIIRDLAHLQAFYLNKAPEAMKLLKKALNIRNLPYTMQAICKLELGDIQLLTGDVWEAVLTYGQVEKANSENPYGHRARFKKAKVAYYTGKFQWAKAQLDVLKASTSKLIANDAAELSLLISDNLNEDTVSKPLKIYAHADLLLAQNKDSLALTSLDSLLKAYPQHNIIDDVYYKKAQIYRKENRDSLATNNYKQLIKEYPYSILADNALYALAQLYEKQGDIKTAMSYYKQLMLDHPDSLFTQEARKHFRTLRGDFKKQAEEGLPDIP